jgi:hypothetical protein
MMPGASSAVQRLGPFFFDGRLAALLEEFVAVLVPRIKKYR